MFRAHAEAPLAGSIILAAVILKLASYGFLRVLIPFFPDATLYFLPLVQTIAAITIIYASLSTLRQIDNKQLVAMSSVAQYGPYYYQNMQQSICGNIIYISLCFIAILASPMGEGARAKNMKFYIKLFKYCTFSLDFYT